MTIYECYTALGGDYQEVLGRLRSGPMIQKFVLKFPEDGNYECLCRSMEAGEQEAAFRAAHTIKGMCQNLGFVRLAGSSSQLTEALRAGDMDSARSLFAPVCRDYDRTVKAIRAFQAEQ